MIKKLGLCLSGGGARGAYQIGSVQALIDLGIYEDIECFSGTSIGAANISVIATSGVDNAKNIWFNIPEKPLISTMSFRDRFSIQYLKSLDQGIFETTFLEESLAKEINFLSAKDKDIYVTISDGGQIQKSVYALISQTFKHYIKKDAKVIYVPLKELNKTDIIKAVLASCAIPVVFPAIKSGEKKYYDGGLFDNVPIFPLISAGCTEIIVIHLGKSRFFDTNKWDHIKFHEIKSKKSLGSILKFSTNRSKKLYQRGYDDTYQYFINYTKE